MAKEDNEPGKALPAVQPRVFPRDARSRILSLSPGERAFRMPAYWDTGMAMDKQTVAYSYDRTLLGKERNCRSTQQHEWISKTLCPARKARHERIHTAQIHLYEVLEQIKLMHSNRKQIRAALLEGGVDCKETKGNLLEKVKCVMYWLRWMEVARVYIIIKTHRAEHLRFMKFIVCK